MLSQDYALDKAIETGKLLVLETEEVAYREGYEGNR